MYELKVVSRFAAAHNLRNFKSKCENLHGHNWVVEVYVASEELDETGLVMDFGDIKKELAEVLDLLDHQYLNDLEHFKTVNPSSENIARFIYDHLAPRIDKGPVRVTAVAAWESENSRALYSPAGR